MPPKIAIGDITQRERKQRAPQHNLKQTAGGERGQFFNPKLVRAHGLGQTVLILSAKPAVLDFAHVQAKDFRLLDQNTDWGQKNRQGNY
jgi:hypothetical protein